MTGYVSKKAAARDKLAHPAQEPVAWMNPLWIDPDTRGWQSDSFESIPIEGWLPIYTTPLQPAQEPVGVVCVDTSHAHIVYGSQYLGRQPDKKTAMFFKDCEVGEQLYTLPPQRPWVGLTDEELDAIYLQHHNQYAECESPNWGYERAIEALLKEKNT